MNVDFIATTRCANCGGSIERPVDQEENHIWARLELETGFWCSQCRENSEFKKDLLFCSPQCLECYICTDVYWRWKNAFKKEAAKAAQRIRKGED